MSIDIIRFSIRSKVDQIDVIDAVVRDVTEKMGFGEAEAKEIELAIHEAVVNAIVHGSRSSPGSEGPEVDVALLVEPGALTAEIRDRGPGFDPAAVPSPLAAENLLRPGGRGLLYMRTFMEEADITAHPGGGMLVRLRRRLPIRSSSSG